MDEQIAKKQLILNELKRKLEEKNLYQGDITDLKQELERCNHIQKHIIRGQGNFSGGIITGLVFGSLGFAFWKTQKIRKLPLKKLINALLLLNFVTWPALFGFYFGLKRFGNIKELKRYVKMNKDSKVIDDEFYSITNGLKAADLKH